MCKMTEKDWKDYEEKSAYNVCSVEGTDLTPEEIEKIGKMKFPPIYD